jgi:hypothetical protein
LPAGRLALKQDSQRTISESSVCSEKSELRVPSGALLQTGFEKQEWVMDSLNSFGYGRCCQCDEENFFQEGSKCARCLGLSAPIDDENSAKESSNIFFDRPAAA